jgi:hypothetical protein
MHYQNINSFGLLSLAGKKASLVLPFNKAMDNFFLSLAPYLKTRVAASEV